MLIVLAALAQAAPALSEDRLQAALTCRQALVADATSIEFEMAAQFLYFSMQAARTLPGDGDYFQRMAALRTAEAPGVSSDNAAPLRAACDQRFPLARRTGPVALPGGEWERDLMCAGVTTVLIGTAQAHAEHSGDHAPLDRLTPIAARFQPRVAGGMSARGISPEALRRVIGDQIFAALDLGNPLAVATACGAQPADA